jgi:hypothetical protein
VVWSEGVRGRAAGRGGAVLRRPEGYALGRSSGA